MKIQLTADCPCEHDLHEITKYPRPGLTVQRFQSGEVLAVEKEWSNLFGSYYRCETDSLKGYADIKKANAKEVD